MIRRRQLTVGRPAVKRREREGWHHWADAAALCSGRGPQLVACLGVRASLLHLSPLDEEVRGPDHEREEEQVAQILAASSWGCMGSHVDPRSLSPCLPLPRLVFPSQRNAAEDFG
jgi:hypothetical protein